MFPFPFSFVAPTASGLADIDNVYSMEFDGVNDYILINDSPFDTALASTEFSASFWYYTDNAALAFIWSQDFNSQFELYTSAVGWYAYIGGDVAWLPSRPPIITGKWVHVAVIVDQDPTTGGVTMHQTDNTGTNVYTSAPRPAISNPSSTPLYIGRRDNSTFYFEGKLDEFAIFDYGLDSDQVQEIYNATSSGKTADLSAMATPPIAWYRMGD